MNFMEGMCFLNATLSINARLELKMLEIFRRERRKDHDERINISKLTSKFFTLSKAHPRFREVNEIPLIAKSVTWRVRTSTILISKNKSPSSDLAITSSDNRQIQRLQVSVYLSPSSSSTNRSSQVISRQLDMVQVSQIDGHSLRSI